jgi:hypothetical protein
MSLTIKRPTERRPDLAAADSWASDAPAGAARDPIELDKKAYPTKAFHVRFNHYDLWALQKVADLDVTSKQRVARLAIREYVEKRLKKAGIEVP